MDYKEANVKTGCYTQATSGYLQEVSRRKEPHFLQVDKRIKETENEIEFMTKSLESRKVYLKQLEAVRKMVKPADEAKIQALISVGLL